MSKPHKEVAFLRAAWMILAICFGAHVALAAGIVPKE